MPGSRVKEVRMNLPTILEAATQLGMAYEFLLPVAPTLDRSFLSSLNWSEENHFQSQMPCQRSGMRGPGSWPAARRPSRLP